MSRLLRCSLAVVAVTLLASSLAAAEAGAPQGCSEEHL